MNRLNNVGLKLHPSLTHISELKSLVTFLDNLTPESSLLHIDLSSLIDFKVTRSKGYFTHDINGSAGNMYTANNIYKMIEFLTDNIFVQFGGCLFR